LAKADVGRTKADVGIFGHFGKMAAKFCCSAGL